MSLKDKVLKKIEENNKNKDLSKTLRDLPLPHQLKNCTRAAKRIVQNLMDGKKMLVLGDYDADGILATSILMSFLREVGFTEEFVDFKIPSRLEDGYGLSVNLVHYAIENNFDFIVTVDNGISAVEAVKVAKENNIEVIITDHHTVPSIIPDADIIVNPKMPDETFPFREISGATVAWYLTAALNIELKTDIAMAKYLDFVAITIMSDVMPLDNINIPLFNYGLNLIKQRKRYVYNLLWNDWTAPTIDSTELSFSLVPRINAIGRIDDANKGVKLFISKDKQEIYQLYQELTEVNEKRKTMSRQSTKEAEAIISKLKISDDPVIVVRGDFHEGIVGIIAGRLAEKYKRPAYVASYNEKKGVWKGSARTFGNIHLYDLTNQANEFLSGFGGHKGAVGFMVKDENWEKFKDKLNEVGKTFKKEDLIDTSVDPILCELSEITDEVIQIIQDNKPYGNDKKEPIFLVENVTFEIEKELKGGLHYKGRLKQNGTSVPALFFNVEDDFLELIQKILDKVTLQVTMNYNPKNDTFGYEFICNIYK